MKITPELLEKYQLGKCTTEEKTIVEAWLEDTSYIPRDVLKTTISSMSTSVWTKITKTINTDNSGSGHNATIIPLHKRLTKYAAAACILLVTFFGGRFSADTASATTTVEKAKRDHLYIYGGDGTNGKLPGNNFKINFDGTVKLYNESLYKKNIQVGDTSFVLGPQQIYYLKGSVEKPTLWSDNHLPVDHYKEIELVGGFLISRLDNR